MSTREKRAALGKLVTATDRVRALSELTEMTSVRPDLCVAVAALQRAMAAVEMAR